MNYLENPNSRYLILRKFDLATRLFQNSFDYLKLILIRYLTERISQSTESKEFLMTIGIVHNRLTCALIN